MTLYMERYLPSSFVIHPLLARITLAGLFLFSYSIASAQGISILSGNGQLICSLCPTRSFTFDPLVVMVKDALGNPVPNATVSWTAHNDKGVDGRVSTSSTTTGADGTSSNTYFMSAPITLLTPFLQGTVTASAMGSSVTFTETNGAMAPGTGIAEISSNLQSPIPGTKLTGSPVRSPRFRCASRYPPFSRAGRCPELKSGWNRIRLFLPPRPAPRPAC